MSIEIDIRKLGSVFQGRLDNGIITFSLEYCDHGEYRLALETLCDQICEEDVALSELEYQEFLRLAQLIGADLNAGRFKYLKNLVSSA